MYVAKPGPAPCALTATSALIGPPVRPDLSAMSASDSGSKLLALAPAGQALPSFHSTASEVPDYQGVPLYCGQIFRITPVLGICTSAASAGILTSVSGSDRPKSRSAP